MAFRCLSPHLTTVEQVDVLPILSMLVTVAGQKVPSVRRMQVEDAIALLSHAIHAEAPNEAVQKLCIPHIVSQFQRISSGGLNSLPPNVVVDLLDMNGLKVSSEDQVYKVVVEYLRSVKNPEAWRAQLWSTCRYAYLSTELLEVAVTNTEIPPQVIQVGMLSRIYRNDVGSSSGTSRQLAAQVHSAYVSKYSGQNAGAQDARGDYLRPRC